MRVRTEKAFSLTEMVMIIVIIGILAAAVVARYFDITNEAKAAAEKGVVAGAVAGIYTYYLQNRAYPPSLDSAGVGQACVPGNACFTAVLGHGGITQDWVKAGVNTYVGPTGTIYVYVPNDGSFR
jgi:type II secretory pathway pseudopilin PulG